MIKSMHYVDRNRALNRTIDDITPSSGITLSLMKINFGCNLACVRE